MKNHEAENGKPVKREQVEVVETILAFLLKYRSCTPRTLKRHIAFLDMAKAWLRFDIIGDGKFSNGISEGISDGIPCHPEFKPYMARMRPETDEERFSPFFFTCPNSKTVGKRYTDRIANLIWRTACKKAGEDIDLYSGMKHSSCSQYVNEKGLSKSDLQQITDHARLNSLDKYVHMGMARKRELMQTKVIRLDYKKDG